MPCLYSWLYRKAIQTSSSDAPATTALVTGVTLVEDTCSPSIAKVVMWGAANFDPAFYLFP
jgi:hypothetical protein